MTETALILVVAFALDLILGDPVYPVHPVRLIGAAVTTVEKSLRRLGLDGIGGGFLLITVVTASSIAGVLWIQRLFDHLPYRIGALFSVFIVYSCLSLKDLLRHAERVSVALAACDLPEAKRFVQAMVGRDAGVLDADGVARAAVESTAENVVDGVLSPFFWYVVAAWIAWAAGMSPSDGAVSGILGQRVVNTLDSMVGYRNGKYRYFGRPAARLDDIMNFFPARLSIPFIFLGAVLSGSDGGGCLRCSLRDRKKHDSPNSGHAESAVAGALDIRLGGPTVYPHGLLEKPWLGDGHSEIAHTHIRTTCRIVFWTGLIAFGLAQACLILPVIF